MLCFYDITNTAKTTNYWSPILKQESRLETNVFFIFKSICKPDYHTQTVISKNSSVFKLTYINQSIQQYSRTKISSKW